LDRGNGEDGMRQHTCWWHPGVASQRAAARTEGTLTACNANLKCAPPLLPPPSLFAESLTGSSTSRPESLRAGMLACCTPSFLLPLPPASSCPPLPLCYPTHGFQHPSLSCPVSCPPPPPGPSSCFIHIFISSCALTPLMPVHTASYPHPTPPHPTPPHAPRCCPKSLVPAPPAQCAGMLSFCNPSFLLPLPPASCPSHTHTA
jgi:hypothetical protein